ncbi:hypothetical protein ACWCYK_05925 [Streptomyces lydicamycinicus]
MTENFTFYGQTTFINRPVDTVIRDFQNTHGSVPHEEDLAALLRAVLAAPLNEADREQAARTVVQVADDLAVPGPTPQGTGSRRSAPPSPERPVSPSPPWTTSAESCRSWGPDPFFDCRREPGQSRSTPATKRRAVRRPA